MSNVSDVSDIAFQAYRDLMSAYATLLKGIKYLDNMINCLDEVLEQGRKCVHTNYKLCISLVINRLEPCYIDNIIPFFEYIGSEFEKAVKGSEWMTGGRGSSSKFVSDISKALSKPVMKVMPIIDFIISLARVEGGMGEKEDIEMVNTFFPKMKEFLRQHGAYVEKPRDIFYSKPFTTTMLYLIHWLTVSRDTLQSQANMLRRRAYDIIMNSYRVISL